MLFPPDLTTDESRRRAFRASTRAGFGPSFSGKTIHTYQARHCEAWDAIEAAAEALRESGVPVPEVFKVRRRKGVLGVLSHTIQVHVPGRGWYTLGAAHKFTR